MKIRITSILSVFAVAAATQASAATITVLENDFNEASDIANITASNSGFTGFDISGSLDSGESRSAPTSLLSRAGGGSGTDEQYLDWDLGGDFDLYAGGTGEVSVWASRQSTTRFGIVELYDGGIGGTLVGSGQFDFSSAGSFNQFEEITVALDGDETSVDTIRFINRRNSGSSSVWMFWDDFEATAVPEPASMALLGLGSLVLVGRRRTHA